MVHKKERKRNMSIENESVFTWNSSTYSESTITIENSELELSISNGDYLWITNKKNGKKGILRKELIINAAYQSPGLLRKGGFCLIWKPEVCDELGDVVEQQRGFTIEPNKKDGLTHYGLASLTQILHLNKVPTV